MPPGLILIGQIWLSAYLAASGAESTNDLTDSPVG